MERKVDENLLIKKEDRKISVSFHEVGLENLTSCRSRRFAGNGDLLALLHRLKCGNS